MNTHEESQEQLDDKFSSYDWVLDEKSNAIDFLEKAVRFLLEVDKDYWALKWVSISLHGALYGFGVCAVCGVNSETDDYNVITLTKSKIRCLKGFDTIIKMCQDEKVMGKYVFSKPLQLSTEQRKSISWLKSYIRNQVEHFFPSIYVIGLNGIPQALSDCFQVIRFLAIESGNIILQDDEHAWVHSLCNSGNEISLKLRINTSRVDKLIKKPYLMAERITENDT